jgi:hypothetical protein
MVPCTKIERVCTYVPETVKVQVCKKVYHTEKVKVHYCKCVAEPRTEKYCVMVAKTVEKWVPATPCGCETECCHGDSHGGFFARFRRCCR